MNRQQDIQFASSLSFRRWGKFTGRGVLFAAAGFVLGTVATRPAEAQVYTVLHSFNSSDGAEPTGGVIKDASGNLYGTTYSGGSANKGIVFKLNPSTGILTVVHSFGDGTVANDGAYPIAGLIKDASGNLYGTTYFGGSAGVGTIFKLNTASGVLTVLHSFFDDPNANDGGLPYAGLTLDASGNLYGTTFEGGSVGKGTVFKLNLSSGALTVLHSFADNTVVNDGASPYARLTRDASGNLYGTTFAGGFCRDYNTGCGTVFKLNPSSGALTVLHRFGDGTVANDGKSPLADLTLDASGNLYGTTTSGGSCPNDNAGCGTVFKLNPSSGVLTVLHSFGDDTVPNDGLNPYAGLTLDASGNVYGTTAGGGSADEGTVFKLNPSSGVLTLLHSFGDGTFANDGITPYAGLTLDASGNLYGATAFGGSAGYGTVFDFATTPPSATQSIINQVNALYAQRVLNQGQDNSLVMQLQQAISLMNKRKNAGASQSLQAFMNEVHDLQTSGVLTSSRAALLISEANAIMAELS